MNHDMVCDYSARILSAIYACERVGDAMAPEQVLKRRAILAIQQAQILIEQLEMFRPDDAQAPAAAAPAAAPPPQAGPAPAAARAPALQKAPMPPPRAAGRPAPRPHDVGEDTVDIENLPPPKLDPTDIETKFE